ncbi:MAG: hypothetical protein ACLGI6_13035 [Gammaproteobacteria bacterium]
MRTFPRHAIALIATLLISGNTLAMCTDSRSPTVEAEYAQSDIVATGFVTEHVDVSSSDDPEGVEKTIYQFKVVNSYKGGAHPILLITSDNTSSRFPMERGRPYLVFLRSADGELFIDSCGNSGPSEQRAAVIAQLPRQP